MCNNHIKPLYETIFFDFDGTIVNTTNLKKYAFGKAFEKYGKKIKNKVENFHLKNEGKPRSFKFKYICENFLNLNYEKKIENYLSKKFTQIIYNQIKKVEFIDGAYNFFEKFNNKVKMHIVSSVPDKEIKDLVKILKLTKFFVSIHGFPNDKHEIFEKIINKNNLSRDKILMVGDTFVDYEASEKSKINFISVGDKIKAKNILCLNNYKQLEKVIFNE